MFLHQFRSMLASRENGVLRSSFAGFCTVSKPFPIFVSPPFFLSPCSLAYGRVSPLSESCCFHLHYSYNRVDSGLEKTVSSLEKNLCSHHRHNLTNKARSQRTYCITQPHKSCFSLLWDRDESRKNTPPSEYNAVYVAKSWAHCSKIARLNVFTELWKQVGESIPPSRARRLFCAQYNWVLWGNDLATSLPSPSSLLFPPFLWFRDERCGLTQGYRRCSWILWQLAPAIRSHRRCLISGPQPSLQRSFLLPQYVIECIS